jgi:hypothetical protein
MPHPDTSKPARQFVSGTFGGPALRPPVCGMKRLANNFQCSIVSATWKYAFPIEFEAIKSNSRFASCLLEKMLLPPFGSVGVTLLDPGR